MHLLAPTKRSAFYIEEKRQTEERHIIPLHLIVLHLPANGGHGTEPNPTRAVHRGTDWTLLSKALTWR